MSEKPTTDDKLELTGEQWRERLDAESHAVLREGATERAFTGCLWNEKREGAYDCKGCGATLFRSGAKYESGSGWPSFFQPVEGAPIVRHRDESLGMRRVEIRCGRCDGHLGHLFEDGPPPTGLRYCVNSASLDFRPGES